MSRFLHSFPVNLQGQKGSQQTRALFVTQDNGADRVQAEVYNGNDPYTITGTVAGYIMLGSGETVVVEGDSDGNKAFIDLPQLAYSVPGMITITIKETVDEVVTSLLQVVATVRRSTTGTEVDPGETMETYDSLIAEIERVVATIPEDYNTLNDIVNLVTPVPGKSYYHMVMGACWNSGVSVHDMNSSTKIATIPDTLSSGVSRTLVWDDTVYKIGLIPLNDNGTGTGSFYWYETSPATAPAATVNLYRTFMIRRKDDADIGAVNLDALLYEPTVVENPLVARFNETTETLENAVAASEAETWQGFVRYEFPSAFTWTDNPVADKVTTDGKGRFRVNYNVLDHISTTGVDVYIAPTGSDSNDGLTALTPKKTLSAAIGITNARRVHIAGGYYPREEITLSADIDLLGDPENRAVFTGQNANSTWTATATTGVYTTAHKNYGVVYDLTDTSTGEFRKYTEAASTAAVESTEGTFYDDGTTVTIHTYGDEEPTLDKVCYAQGWSALRVLLKGHTALAAHLCFICSGGYSGRGQLMFDGDTTDRGAFLMYNCDSSYSLRSSSDNISGGSAINPHDADGVIQYCTSYHAGNDGFSYGAGCKIVEIGCASAFNGTELITSCNGSTAHGGSYIRINGSYHDTHGPVVHDVGATESVNLGLAAWHSTCAGKPNFCASGGYVKMWLDSCVGYSSDAGIDVGKPDESAPNAVIYKRNCTSDIADGEYGGHIYRY